MPNASDQSALRASSIFLPVVLLGFLALLGFIVLMPVESGDALPPYSTLRADPLGAKVLYDSLAELPGLRVERNFQPRLPMKPGATVFQLGTSGPGWYDRPETTWQEYEQAASAGVRVVVAFLPSLPALDANFDVFQRRRTEAGPSKERRKSEVEKRWGVRFALRKARPSERLRMGRIPQESALYFEPDASWRVLAKADDGKAEEIEKAMGAGKIVLVTRSFRLSNEALRDRADADWVSSLVGPNRHVIFDESPLGIAETGSVATLIRRYRLQGSVAVLMLIGMLFIWRSASSLLPACEQASGAAVAGRDAREGMVTLLQRSIPKHDLLDVCRREWQRSLALRPGVSTQRLEAVQRVDAADAIQGYKEIHRILTEPK